jgi:RNA polymerase sigma factor (sigma-70 family)
MLSASEEAQFFVFHAKTSPGLFRKAYRMCRGHEADAQDALQLTYLKAMEHWLTLSSLTDPQRHGWLATTLTREILQMWRAPHRSRETGPSEDSRAEPADADNASVTEHRDRLHQACRVIAGLGGRPGEVMALHCLAGYEISEVAEILGISQGTVRVHLHTGRVRLQAMVAGHEDGDRDHA